MKINNEIATCSSYAFYAELQNPYYYPVFDPRYPFDAGAEITLGDLHANVMTLIHMGIYHGIYTLSQKCWQDLREIFFQKPETLTPEVQKKFRNILDKATISQENSKGLLRLLGDEIADRAGCDLLTLFFLEFLSKNNIRYRIVLSNHGYEAIHNFEQGSPFQGYCIGTGKEGEFSDENPYIQSLIALQKVIDCKHITRETVDSLFSRYYFPNLVCVDYSLSENNRLSWYTHSYTPAITLSKLAREFEIPDGNNLLTDNLDAQIAVLDAIQEKFRIIVEAKSIHQFVKIDKIGKPWNDAWSALGWMIWTRFLEENREECDNRILHVNGHHHFAEEPPENYLVLNPGYGFGKIPLEDINNAFEVNAFYYTHESKKRNHWHFREALNRLKSKTLLADLSETELSMILNEEDIHSSWHIDTLDFLLFDKENTQAFWKKVSSLGKAQGSIRDLILSDVYFRDTLYLLHKMRADTAENILLIMNNSTEDHQAVFLSLRYALDLSPQQIGQLLALPSLLKSRLALPSLLKSRLAQVLSVLKDNPFNPPLKLCLNSLTILWIGVVYERVKHFLPQNFDWVDFIETHLKPLQKQMHSPEGIRKSDLKKLFETSLQSKMKTKICPEYSLDSLASCWSLLTWLEKVKAGHDSEILLQKPNLENAAAIWDLVNPDDLNEGHLHFIFSPKNFHQIVLWFKFLQKQDCLSARTLYIGSSLRSRKCLSAGVITLVRQNPERVLFYITKLLNANLYSEINMERIETLTRGFTRERDFEELKTALLDMIAEEAGADMEDDLPEEECRSNTEQNAF